VADAGGRGVVLFIKEFKELGLNVLDIKEFKELCLNGANVECQITRWRPWLFSRG
jgi:hypothetical protein